MYKTSLIFIICSTCLLISFVQYYGPQEESFNQNRDFLHLSYLLDLKQDVAGNYWPDFASQELYSPLLYFTKEGTYVINPNEHIVTNIKHETVSIETSKLPVIKLEEKYLDTINFQFSNNYSTNKNDIYYHENVLYFDSFELIRKFIPDLVDIQDWSIMVIHELFHSYQRSVPAHRAYFEALEIPGGPDEYLGAYYENLAWFKESVDRENEILKSIWKEDSDVATSIYSYDSLRTQRLMRIEEEYHV
ncbi:hypothetical protein, partial [Lutimonas sp.]|uniref:hypothetical protein n=1 Tax=Lutimonas sp. TaxID=1872403 RepID=UPI003D9AC04C